MISTRTLLLCKRSTDRQLVRCALGLERGLARPGLPLQAIGRQPTCTWQQSRFFSASAKGRGKAKGEPQADAKKPGFRELQAKEIKNEKKMREQVDLAEASFQKLNE